MSSSSLFGKGGIERLPKSQKDCLTNSSPPSILGIYDSLLKWPYNYRTTFYLLDQNCDHQKRKHISFSVKPNVCPENEPFLGRPRSSKNPSFGAGKFASHEDINKGQYVKDNTMFIKVIVDCDGFSEP